MEQQKNLKNIQAKKLEKAFTKSPEAVHLLVNENAEQDVLERQIKLIKKLSQKFEQQTIIKIGLYGIKLFTGFTHQITFNQKKKQFKIPDEIEERLENRIPDQVSPNQGWFVFEKLAEELFHKQSQVQNLVFIISNNLDNLFPLQGDQEDQMQEYIKNIEFVNTNCYLTFLLENDDNKAINYEDYEIKTSRIVQAKSYKYISKYLEEKIERISNILPIEDYKFANRILKLSFKETDMTTDFEIILTNIVNHEWYKYSIEKYNIQRKTEISITNQKYTVLYIKSEDFGKYRLKYRTKLEKQTWSDYHELQQEINFESIQQHLNMQLMNKDYSQIKTLVNNLLNELEKYTLPQEFIDLGITKINFAFFGEMGVGKSSTINTLINAVGGQCQQVVSNGDKSCTLNLQEISSFSKLKSLCAYDTAGFELSNKHDKEIKLIDIKQTQYGNQTLKYLLQGRLQKNSNLTSKNTDALSNLRPSELQNRIHTVIIIVDISMDCNTQFNIQLLKSFILQLNNSDGAVYTPIILFTKCDSILKVQIGDRPYNMKDLYETYQMEFKNYYDQFTKEIINEIDNIQKEYMFPFINKKSSIKFSENNNEDLYDKFFILNIIKSVQKQGEINIRSFLQNYWIIKVQKCNDKSNKCIGYIKKTANTSSDKIDKIIYEIKKLVQESNFLENIKTWSIIANNQSSFNGQIIKQDEVNINICDILHDDQYIIIDVVDNIQILDIQQDQKTQNDISSFSILTNTPISSGNGKIMAIYYKFADLKDFKTQKIKVSENDTLHTIRGNIQKQCKFNLDQYGFPNLPAQIDEVKCSASEYFKNYSQKKNNQIEFCQSNIQVQVLFEEEYQNININQEAKYDSIKKAIIKRYPNLNYNDFGFFQFEGEIDSSEEADLCSMDDFIRIDKNVIDVKNYGIQQLSSQNKKGDKGLVIFEI